MVKSLFRPFRRWPGLEAFFGSLAAHLRTWPAEDFNPYVSARVAGGLGGGLATFSPPAGLLRPPSTASQAPASFEMRFTRLHLEGRFEEMWEMLADDAQRAWGSVQNFIREMPRLDEWLEILDLQVASVAILENWTDHVHQRTYDNVARLVMRYRVRQQWREWTFDRQVHLIPSAGEWRTLCYPTRTRTAVGR